MKAILISFVMFCATQLCAQSAKETSIFPQGQKVTEPNMTGDVWLHVLVSNDSTFNYHIANVTFERGSRTYWHTHPGGQVLLVVEGLGYYQEKGTEIRILKKGDVIKCPPNIEHWHGAAPTSRFAHVGITNLSEKGRVVWTKEVTDAEYNALKK